VHWGDAYYGALYWESVHDLLTPGLSALEANVILTLLRLDAADRVLDLACGHGRHARVLAARVGALVGIDRSGDYLSHASAPLTPTLSPRDQAGEVSTVAGGEGDQSASPSPSRNLSFVRGDVRALPFAAGSFDAVYSWYASLFMFDDAENLACLAGISRVVRPGGRVLVHHANPLRLALDPHDTARRVLADGTVVEEESVFDAASGIDRSARRLVRPDGSVVAATAELRYYSPAEWKDLSSAAGLRIVEITTTPWAGGAPAGELGPDAPDLIALLEKPT
jgi:SAM-dependent methyltransferase